MSGGGNTISTVTSYTVIDCCNCGALFAVPSQVNADYVASGRRFCCPNGHWQSYTESTAAQLRKERERREQLERVAQSRLDLLRAEERSHAATKGQVTRARKQLARVANGVCPCCKRSFANLERHMTTKHPDYEPAAADPSAAISIPSSSSP